MLTTTAAFIAAALASEDKAPAHGWTVSGFGDGYFGTATPYPGHGQTRVDRQFDTRNGEPRLMVVEVDATYTDPKSGFGAKISPYAGDAAESYYSNDSATNWLAHYFNELYASYTFHDGAKLDAGKFASFVGYGNFNSSQNDVYSQGWVSTAGEPNFHTGLRLNKELTSRLGATLYATNGWNTTERKTAGMSYGAQIRYDLGHDQTLYGAVLTGREGSWHDTNNSGGYGGINFLKPGVSDVTTTDLLYQKNFTETTHVAVDAMYTTSAGAPNNGTYYGLVLSGLKDLGKGYALGLRLETIADSSGILYGASSTIQSVAVDGRYQIDARSMVRLELRADKSNTPLFNDFGGGMTDHQTTLNLAYFVTF